MDIPQYQIEAVARRVMLDILAPYENGRGQRNLPNERNSGKREVKVE
nr:hypothetical protein [uncultured Oscillibacter sp.]